MILPGTHNEQNADFDDDWYVPCGHAIYEVEPGDSAYVPDEHGVQTDDAFIAEPVPNSHNNRR